MNVIQSVPPVLGTVPLPWGQHDLLYVTGKAVSADCVQERQMAPPLPKGEGWGEGESSAQPGRVFKYCDKVGLGFRLCWRVKTNVHRLAVLRLLFAVAGALSFSV